MPKATAQKSNPTNNKSNSYTLLFYLSVKPSTISRKITTFAGALVSLKLKGNTV